MSEDEPPRRPTSTPLRRKDDTIGTLGRSPARVSGKLPPMSPRQPEPAPDRGVWLRHHLREAFLGNLGLKFLSLVLALTVFLLVNTDRDREITARVGVSYAPLKDRVLVSERLTEVRVGVRGPWRRLRRFDEREIDRIELDLNSVQDGELAITPSMIKLPAGLTLTSISPKTLHVSFEKRVERSVAVTAVIAGRPKHGYKVESVKPEPVAATAAGAEGVIKALTELRTREVRVDGQSATFTAETRLVPPDGVEVGLAGPVTVTVEIKDELETRRLGKVAVRVVGDGIDPIGIITDPPAIEVSLTGAVRLIDEAIEHGIVPTVKVTAADGSRKRTAQVVVEGLPAGVGIELVPATIDIAPVVKPRPKPAPTAPGPAP